MPTCADVWRPGKVLKVGYNGCQEDGAVVAPALLACKKGSTFTTFDDRYYAVIGQRVAAVRGSIGSDQRYSTAYKECLHGPRPKKPTPTPTTPTPTPTPSEPPTQAIPGPTWPGTPLTQRVRNDFRADVVVVQQRLNALGYGPLVEDGHYGPLTEVAVRQFQVDQGLAVDGVVGAVTWGALFG